MTKRHSTRRDVFAGVGTGLLLMCADSGVRVVRGARRFADDEAYSLWHL